MQYSHIRFKFICSKKRKIFIHGDDNSLASPDPREIERNLKIPPNKIEKFVPTWKRGNCTYYRGTFTNVRVWGRLASAFYSILAALFEYFPLSVTYVKVNFSKANIYGIREIYQCTLFHRREQPTAAYLQIFCRGKEMRTSIAVFPHRASPVFIGAVLPSVYLYGFFFLDRIMRRCFHFYW